MDLQKVKTKLKEENETTYIPMYSHRRYIGILGFLLPVLCLIFGRNYNGMCVQRSISAYYHTPARDLFIGAMVGVAVFLFTYRGYERRDNISSYIGGTAAGLVALFPTTIGEKPASEEFLVGVLQLPEKYSAPIHLTSAFLLFLVFAYQCIFLFSKSNTRWRNIVYYVCGSTILLCILIIAGFFIFNKTHLLHSGKGVLILEVLMLVLFGITWMVKGRIGQRMKNLKS